LYSFSLAFFALLLGLLLIQKSARWSAIVPIPFTILEFAVFFVVGAIMVIALTYVMKDRWKYLNMACILFLLVGAVCLNLFNMYRIPTYLITAPGDLRSLGVQRWHKPPYEVYQTAYEQYFLRRILVHPELLDFVDLARIGRFGIYLEVSEDSPDALTALQFARIDAMDDPVYVLYTHDNLQYRLYETTDSYDDIVLTRYGNTILFIPMSLIEESD
jgi:hypothetical protein